MMPLGRLFHHHKSDSVDDLLGGFGAGAYSNSKIPKQNEAGLVLMI